jgi:hypothetical protein
MSAFIFLGTCRETEVLVQEGPQGVPLADGQYAMYMTQRIRGTFFVSTRPNPDTYSYQPDAAPSSYQPDSKLKWDLSQLK